jgi:hypothetical protein
MLESINRVCRISSMPRSRTPRTSLARRRRLREQTPYRVSSLVNTAISVRLDSSTSRVYTIKRLITGTTRITGMTSNALRILGRLLTRYRAPSKVPVQLASTRPISRAAREGRWHLGWAARLVGRLSEALYRALVLALVPPLAAAWVCSATTSEVIHV